MNIRLPTLLLAALVVLILLPGLALAQSLAPFAGAYEGSAEVIAEGEADLRDMSVTIEPRRSGFVLTWASVITRADGARDEKTHTIEFLPSVRDNIYGSAMKTDVFGKQVPLNPLEGEPFVWARLERDTLSVYSLYIDEVGEYRMQEYHRTLVEGGLNLRFVRLYNGVAQKEVRAFLQRVE